MCVYIFMCAYMCRICVCICVCAHMCGYLSWVRLCTWKAEMDFGISNCSPPYVLRQGFSLNLELNTWLT